MPTKKITKRVVDKALPGTSNYLIRDSELKGFVLVVTPLGAKSYAIDYRAGPGRKAQKRRITIGKHGSDWTPVTARVRAGELIGQVKNGRDPAQERRASINAITVSELCDLYFSEGVAHKKASTLEKDVGRSNNYLKPLLGRRRVNSLTRADIERMMLDVCVGKAALKAPARRAGGVARGGKGTANQCVALIGTMLTFAVNRDLRADNPARNIKKFPGNPKNKFLTETEIARLGAAIEQEERASGSPYATAAIKMLLLTGCRRGEIQNLRWEDIDRNHRLLRLPDSKTGAKIVYLNAPTLALLDQIPKLEGHPKVFPGQLPGKSISIDKAWQRIRRLADLSGVRIHDLRHSFASVGAAGGFSLQIIGALLGHKHSVTTARYAHLSADPLRAANEAIGQKIHAAFGNPSGQRPAHLKRTGS